MAKVFGTSGGSTFNKYQRDFNRVFLLLIILMAANAFIAGYTIRSPNGWGMVATILMVVLAWLLLRTVDAKVKKSFNYRKGALGETLVSDALDGLPDGYYVFHDSTHASFGGNIDHLVVCPQGVFNIETKNWTGTVGPGQNGTLLLNGRQTDKPVVSILNQNSRALSEKIKAFTNSTYYVQSVMVFPHTYIAIDRGTQNAMHVDMKTLDELEDYLKAPRGSRALEKSEVEQIVKHLAALVSLTRT